MKIENARIEKVKENRFVVKGDTIRFGADAILFESYKEEECKKYLAKHELVKYVDGVKVSHNCMVSYADWVDEMGYPTSDELKEEYPTSWIDKYHDLKTEFQHWADCNGLVTY